ncbi:MAG: hypothetical protein ACTSR4_08855 [Candidatus Hodarchaeales archaeon]
MLRKETLEQLSEAELEKIYQEKKAEYDQQIRKNKRIQGILSRKRDKLKSQVKTVQDETDLLHAKNPGINVNEEGISGNTDQLKATIQKQHTTILNLQTKQIKQKKRLKEIKLEYMKRNTDENLLQKEIDQLIAENDKLSDKNQDDQEKMELAVITSEYQSTEDILETLTVEIEHIHRKLHQRG